MPTSSGDTLACHTQLGLLRPVKREEPPLSLKDAFTDSGYASALAPSRQQKDANPAQDDTSKPVVSTAVDDCDTRTVYSDEGSIGGAELDAYKGEFVDDLVSKARRLGAEPEALDKIFEAMPQWMESFALALGQTGSTQAQRDVMYFVHKYRFELSCRFKELMLGLCEDDTTPDREPDPVDSEVTSSRISEWLVGLGAPGADEPAPACEPQAAAALPEDDEIHLPDRHQYRQVIFESAAYNALVARLERQALLTTLTEADAMMTIRHGIVQRLQRRQDYSRHISRHTEAATFEMGLHVGWRPLTFLNDQYDTSKSPGKLIQRVITLTGSMNDAQALPCSEYMSQTWPTTGPHILAAVVELLETGRQAFRVLPDGSEITVLLNSRGLFQALVKGTADFIAEAGVIVAWLAAALRCSGDEERAAVSCAPHLVGSGNLLHRCTIKFRITTDTQTGHVAGRCWHGMFHNPVVVKGFPIPRRPRPNTGLEIPLHMAARLTGAIRLHDFLGRFCLKGFSAMLVAVEAARGIVLWHLHCNTTGRRVSYRRASLMPHLANVDANVLRSSRHVIGWCSEAECLTGEFDRSWICPYCIRQV
ncbi:hypothetical protein N658DRAFT_437414 [Parathielavia hyrcaniae]|uniref:Uncharacterized protein n=1 Tax=Parathielavia hyrcaniae TaxID=113614 RepID=A0AAN6SWW9_9PEZI|nr:hypothetical protein N658DRAFT_437414 [Parathielavia hyrcaniae]